MCSCSRDSKPHTEACQASHRRYNRGPKQTRQRALYVLRLLGVVK